MLEQIRTEHDLDYIMITGDYPAHDVWLQSRWAQTLFPIYLQIVYFQGTQPRHGRFCPRVAHRGVSRHPGGPLPRQPRALPLQHVGDLSDARAAHMTCPCCSIAGSTAGVEGDQFSPDWLLSELSEYFSAWLPGPQLESFRQARTDSVRFGVIDLLTAVF